jgi:hypothetical protein
MAATDVFYSDALYALYWMVSQQMAGEELWGDRVYPDVASLDNGQHEVDLMPYVVFFDAGSQEENYTLHQDATCILTVKVVALTLREAMMGAARISARLNDQGIYDRAPTMPLPQHPDWFVTTVTQGRRVHIPDVQPNVATRWHSGHQFEFVMERKRPE